MAEKAKTRKAAKERYFRALFEGTPQGKAWGDLSKEERDEVAADYNKKVEENKL